MKKIFFLLFVLMPMAFYGQLNNNLPMVKTENGMLEGIKSSGINLFLGVPFAQPPVGDLRWKAPQPVKNWEGIRKADWFGSRAKQENVFGDMAFRSKEDSEDCLYLNVWTPAKSGNERLPVLVYFYGGGYVAGDASEYRYDGESMARKGIVAVTVNYRLGIFGFFAHPELSEEAPYRGSGNYGLLDQNAALKWVTQNIAAFGGDPEKITIAGESAGSISVSCQVASPLSRDLIAGAIGESGALIYPTLPPVPLAEAEEEGAKFAKSLGANSLAELRAMSADKLLNAASPRGVPSFPIVIDGYFLPKSVAEIFAAGDQAHVPQLIGWNSQESGPEGILGDLEPTPANYRQTLEQIYKDKADEAMSFYPASNKEVVMESARALAGDRFLAFGTWKWIDLCSKTGESPVYRYFYERPRPAMRAEMGNVIAGLAGGVIENPDTDAPAAPIPTGAVHSAEIEYALGNLPTNRVYDWQAEDYKVSAIMQEYFANFIKTGNPNALGLPDWKPVNIAGESSVMHINVNTRSEVDKTRERYQWLDQQYNAEQKK